MKPTSAESSHAARILAREAAWRAAVAGRDLDGMMTIYAPDASELLPGLPMLAGKDAIRAFYQDRLAKLPRFAHAFEAHEILVAAAGDLAVVRGSYQFTADSRRPDRFETGRFLGVWRYREGDWQLLMNFSQRDTPG